MSIEQMIAEKRAEKAARIVEVCEQHGITLQDAEAADDQDWKMAAVAAGYKSISRETRGIVIGMMRAKERK